MPTQVVSVADPRPAALPCVRDLFSSGPMSNRWYYKSAEVEVGPVSFSGLRRMALEGTIGRETPVREGQEGEWTSAGDVQNLFAPKRSRSLFPPA